MMSWEVDMQCCSYTTSTPGQPCMQSRVHKAEVFQDCRCDPSHPFHDFSSSNVRVDIPRLLRKNCLQMV